MEAIISVPSRTGIKEHFFHQLMHAGWAVTVAIPNTLISFGTSSLRHISYDEKTHSVICFTEKFPKRLFKYTMYEITIY